MCGIVGYIGSQNACPFLLTGLQRLEYRGYDSAGIATLRPAEGIRVTKTAGRVAELVAAVQQSNMVGPLGIGHTRWATHGAATRENAHPHVGGQGLLTLAHNGVIENYESLKQTLLSKGSHALRQTHDRNARLQCRTAWKRCRMQLPNCAARTVWSFCFVTSQICCWLRAAEVRWWWEWVSMNSSSPAIHRRW